MFLLKELINCINYGAVIAAFFGFVGTVAWLDLFGTEWTYRVLEDDKFYGNADFVQHYLIIPIMLYQFWNTVLCFVLNDMRDPVMMVHHSLTGLLAYAATHPFACYYALFFFGMSETTQLPLTVIDVLDHFPDIKKNHGTIDAVSKNLFGLLFFIIRIFFWTIVSIEFWKESLSLLQQSHVHDKRVVVFMLFANVILTSMQYFWAIKIIKIAIFSSPPVIKKD